MEKTTNSIKQQNLDDNAICGSSYPAPSNDHSIPSSYYSPYLLSPHLYDKGLFAAMQSFTWTSTRDHSFNYQLFDPQFLAELWRKKLTDSQDSIFWLFYGTYKINPVWKLIERTKFLENLVSQALFKSTQKIRKSFSPKGEFHKAWIMSPVSIQCLAALTQSGSYPLKRQKTNFPIITPLSMFVLLEFTSGVYF